MTPLLPISGPWLDEVSVIEPRTGRVLETVCRSPRAERSDWDALADDLAVLRALLSEMKVHARTMDTARKLAFSAAERVERLRK